MGEANAILSAASSIGDVATSIQHVADGLLRPEARFERDIHAASIIAAGIHAGDPNVGSGVAGERAAATLASIKKHLYVLSHGQQKRG